MEPGSLSPLKCSQSLTRLLVALLFAFVLAAPAMAVNVSATTDEIRGLWLEGAKRKVAVWIEDCGGLLCGRIYWLQKPLSADDGPKRDLHNPNPTLRNRKLCGMTILNGFQREQRNVWGTGQIYNPGDGRSFSGTLSLEDNGMLKVRGYVGVPLFGKTTTWVRPQQNLKKCS